MTAKNDASFQSYLSYQVDERIGMQGEMIGGSLSVAWSDEQRQLDELVGVSLCLLYIAYLVAYGGVEE